VRLDRARIVPLEKEQWSEETREALKTVTNEKGKALNIFATLANSPAAVKPFLAWASYILQGTKLTPREREILILRIGHLCNSGYEFHQHTRIGLRSGLSESDIQALRKTTDDGDWSEAEVLLIEAADQLHGDSFIGTETWTALAEHYNDKQLMDIVFVVGQYTQVSMLLNTFGVQIETKE